MHDVKVYDKKMDKIAKKYKELAKEYEKKYDMYVEIISNLVVYAVEKGKFAENLNYYSLEVNKLQGNFKNEVALTTKKNIESYVLKVDEIDRELYN